MAGRSIHPENAIEYTPDPSGNNDCIYECTVCKKQASSRMQLMRMDCRAPADAEVAGGVGTPRVMTAKERKARYLEIRRRVLTEVARARRPFTAREVYDRVRVTTRGDRQCVDLFLTKLVRKGLVREVWRKRRYVGLECVL